MSSGTQKAAKGQLGSSHSLTGRFMLRGFLGWVLLAVMGVCCLFLAFLPERWHLIQTIAAMLQMFCAGIVAALLLPIWDPVPGAPEEDKPTSTFSQTA